MAALFSLGGVVATPRVLRLRADRMEELGHADALSYETVRRTLEKTTSSEGCRT